MIKFIIFKEEVKWVSVRVHVCVSVCVHVHVYVYNSKFSSFCLSAAL